MGKEFKVGERDMLKNTAHFRDAINHNNRQLAQYVPGMVLVV